MQKILEFTSTFDGSTRNAILLAPEDAGDKPLPLVIVPHAAGYTAKFTSGYWKYIPDQYNVYAIFPFGHGRRLDLYSLGWKGQLEDLVSLPELPSRAGYQIDMGRIYVVGISMGGLESLLLAARYPDVLAGVATFNAVVDLSTWFSMSGSAAQTLIEEIGGTPESNPDDYAERSPINYVRDISKVPCLMYWDPDDAIVPFQEEQQSGLLYRHIRENNPDAAVLARRHKYGHNWISPGAALKWLLALEQKQVVANVEK